MFCTLIFLKRVFDFLFMAFILAMMPIAYWFVMFVVLPVVHEDISLGYICHVILATFLLVNTTSNYAFLVFTDTSVKKAVNPAQADPKTWKFCLECDIFIPPRSWHCAICNTCILRRDHHCQFGRCCIGYKNYRYFFMFLISLAFSTVYMGILTTLYVILPNFEFNHMRIVLNVVFPMAMALIAISPYNMSDELTAEQWYTLFYAINLFGVAISSVLLWKHGFAIIRGMVMCEVTRKVYDYDLGSVKLNLIQVLGHRWYLTWMSPLMYSELPSDGMSWATRECKTVKVM